MVDDNRTPDLGESRRVAILMATLNGAAYIHQQLASIAKQSHHDWFLVVSDDGSTDGTLDHVAQFERRCAQPTVIRKGPRNGAFANFLSMAVDPSIKADYFAYSDQDDIWHSDKLSRALAWFEAIPQHVPALYCGRTELMQRDGKVYGLSPLFTRRPDFRNALVQSIAGGNTMVYNRVAKRLLEQVGMVEAVSHDWWIYQLVSFSDGMIHYDPKPAIKYRQHGKNLVGSNLGWKARFARVRMIMDGRYGRWNEINLAALATVPMSIASPSNRRVIEQFAMARSGPLMRRCISLWRSGVYRQTLPGNLGLVAATILKKI
jgi:glycosyltransferase involved in cell wall biosynthesis